MGVGVGGRKKRKFGKYFSGNCYLKFGHFGANIRYNSGILLIFFLANIIKARAF